ncbi:MAG: manganese efflux pump MntP family protein [Trebonia sp.]
MLALILVALSLCLSNFAVAIGIGISGTTARAGLQVGVIFGLFETGMPIAGLALGRSLASTLGSAAHWISAGLLIATGAWTLAQAIRSGPREAAPAADGQRAWRLLVTGLAISIDNLAAGFALGAFHVSLTVAAITIGAISTGLSPHRPGTRRPGRRQDRAARRDPRRPGPHRGRRRDRGPPHLASARPPAPCNSAPCRPGQRSCSRLPARLDVTGEPDTQRRPREMSSARRARENRRGTGHP